jgi:SAM-dependent methyltransferase
VSILVPLRRHQSHTQGLCYGASLFEADCVSLSHADHHWDEATADAVVLFGPLYHLTDRADRLLALREARRVLRPGGRLVAAAISRFASALDGLCRGYLKDPQFAEIVRRDLTDGQHRNPTGRPEYFMDTFFHHPDELRAEVVEAGFASPKIYGVEGPGWLLSDFDLWWGDKDRRQRLLHLARAVEAEPSLLAVSAHLMVTAIR